MGDNNDGITIIDTIENKYCFMNIYPDGSDRAGSLPYLVPCTARQYVSAYYGETPETVSEYYIEKYAKKRTPQQIANKFKRENDKVVRQFKNFELLTVEDICAMFPKIAKDIKEANNNLVVN